MAPKRSKKNDLGKDSAHEESGIDELVDKTQGFFGVNDPDGGNSESKDATDDFYRPFQNMPDTGADNVPEEEKIQQDRPPASETNIVRNSDKNE